MQTDLGQKDPLPSEDWGATKVSEYLESAGT